MKRSTDRILTTHAGSLPRPADLVAMAEAMQAGEPVDVAAYEARLAEAVGINTRQLARNTFVAGTAWAGIAGVMIAPLTPVEPFMGLTLIVNSFFALVVGGMGTVTGLFAGSGIIGGLESALSAAANPTTAYLAMLLLSILFLWQRPRGLFPRP